MQERMAEVSGLSVDSERMFQLGIQIEAARKIMVQRISSLREKISLAENISSEDVARWSVEFSRARDLMEYPEEGEQIDYLHHVQFDVDVYNQLCEGIQTVFEEFSEGEAFRKGDVLWRLESMGSVIGKRLFRGARV